MKAYTFHNEIHTMLAHFNAALDDVVIKRYRKDRTVEKDVQARYIYGPKTAVMADLVQNKTQPSFPIINTYLVNASRDASRTTATTTSQQYALNPHSRNMLTIAPPQPYTLEVGMTIYSRFAEDMDQLVTNFVPYFDPYIMLSWKHPITNQEIQMKCVWSESIAYNYPNNIPSSTPWVITADTSFRIEGWLFKADQRPTGRILNIHTSFTPVASIVCNYADLEVLQNTNYSECFSVMGQPKPIACSVPCIKPNTATPIAIFGDMFKNVTGVYLSAGPGVGIAGVSAISVFSAASSSTLALCSAFSGIPIDGFIAAQVTDIADPRIKTYLDLYDEVTSYRGNRQSPERSWNMLSFIVPPLSGSGYVDFVVTNPAGCNTLANASVINSVNPYTSGSAEYEQWVAPQYPWYNTGISVG